MTALLCRAALLAALAALTLAPGSGGLAGFGMTGLALADDDDDGGGGDDDDDGPPRRAPPRQQAARPDYVPNELIVINASPEGLARSEQLGFTVQSVEALPGLQITLTRLRPPRALNTAEARALLIREMPQERIDFNHLYRAQAPGPAAACTGSRCFGQRMIGWRDDLAACGAGLRIGIIDTGYDLAHPAFRGARITAANFAPALLPPSPQWHGTGVAALLAGAAQSSAPGLLPGAEYFLADVFHTAPGGFVEADAVSIARALEWLKARSASAINISLSGPQNALLESAIADMLASGAMIVAAAGNDGPKAPPRFPAAQEGVIAVTAVDARMRGYARAGRGAHIAFAAPGAGIWTAWPGGKAGLRTGTSFAAPFVTAALAAAGDTGMQSAAEQARDLGTPGRDAVFGHGLISAPPRCSAREARR